MIFRKFFNQNVESTSFFASRFNISPKIMELILSRGINTEEKIREYLNPSVFHDPFLIKGMKELKERIFVAKELKDKVLVFGDYDVDGVSATAIMIKALKKLGIDASYYLPNRYVDGYGLTNTVIDKLIKKFNPDLIITVDCGISCYSEVEYAKSKGIDIIVTDHHEIPEVIPQTIVLNAKLNGQEYPFKELCGTGLAYKISQALLGEKSAEEFLPIACVATIADIVPLVDENRTIVTRGLKLFEKYLPVGIKHLIKENKIALSKITSTDISFKIAPKLNASGRMGDASDSLKLYLETDLVKIKKYIEKIKVHNQKRQDICNKIFEDCEKALKKINLKDNRVISLASKAWDQGVLGIVCSRLVEKYHRPVFLFSQVGDDLHGSGRSIDDINIHELLSSLKDILETYGGHSMAAGLTLKRDKYEEFTKRVNAFVFEKVDDKVFIPLSYYDEEIKLEEITESFLEELKLLEPVGCSNPKPKFKITASEVEIVPMKKFPQHATIKIADLELIYFNFINHYSKMFFSRQKSFIFEFQNQTKKGLISDFDGGSFIKEGINQLIEPLEIEQLSFQKNSLAKYSYYTKNDLLAYVTSTLPSVFGTAFVTFSAYDYINFSKSYSTQGIFHFGICDEECLGYNSLLLSPIGLEWAKNFSKIVFLSPVLDEGFIAEINKISNAEILIPVDKKQSLHRFRNIDLSRGLFGKIYSKIISKENNSYNNMFDCYFDCFPKRDVSFESFYVALLVFNELQFFKIIKSPEFRILSLGRERKSLNESKLYNKLSLLKNVLRGGDEEGNT